MELCVYTFIYNFMEMLNLTVCRLNMHPEILIAFFLSSLVYLSEEELLLIGVILHQN